MRVLPLVLLTLTLTAPARAQTPFPSDSMEARVDAVFARYDNPGCAVAVLRGDEVVLSKAYGMAHLGFGVPMTTATSLWIPYSEARVFTALAVAMLARDGQVALDAAVRRYVPEVPAYAEAVTVRQLIHHTSGLADYGVLAGPGWDIPDRTSEDEVFRMLARWGRLGFAPGSDEMYSNTDYALLKLLVERVTGGSLHAYLDAQLFGPLGMTSTRAGADQAAAFPGHTLFYEPDGDTYKTLLRYRVSPVGGISVTTSVDDLVRWARALRDPALGLDALLADLEAGAPEDEDGFAFGVYPVADETLRMVTYRGVGEYVYLVRVPEADLSVATLCNAYRGTFEMGPDVARLYAAAWLGTDAPPDAVASVRSTPIATVEVPRAELERYAGEYRARGGAPPAFHIAVGEGGLAFMGPDGRPFVAQPIGEGRFEFDIVPPGIRIRLTLTETPGGDVAMQITEDGEAFSPPLHRWTPWTPTADDLRAYAGTYSGDDVDVTLYVAVEGDRVVMASRGMAATALDPQGQPDTFRIPFYASTTIRFHRDEAGLVTHLTLDTSRVKGMRYTRQPAP